MAGGKLPPRQKMIGMMYLVLTALLALNVSKEILDSFVIINDGLEKTVVNFKSKNSDLYADFEASYQENQKKVKPYYDNAQEIKVVADAASDYIDRIKVNIIALLEKMDTAAVIGPDQFGNDTILNLARISSKDNTDIGTSILIGSEPGKPKTGDLSATALKGKLEDFKNVIASKVDSSTAIYQSLMKTFDFSDKKESGGTNSSWESFNFYGVPAAASITLLSKMQTDIRNFESDAVKYLYSEVDAASFKFNKLEAAVISPSNYILLGDTFRAEIFLAAMDSTKNPKIVVGKDILPDGEGFKSSGDSLNVKMVDGKGYVKVPTRSEGEFTWKGAINFEAPGGKIIPRTFETTYMVAKPSTTISATKMNVFYMGVPNPVSISAPGVPAEAIRPSISGGGGSIKKGTGGEWIVTVTKPGDVKITVNAEMNGRSKMMGSMDFRVKQIPTPKALISGKSSGALSPRVLAAVSGIFLDMEGFVFDVNVDVLSYEFSYVVDGFTSTIKVNGGNITEDVKDKLRRVKRNTTVSFETIKVKMPDGTTRFSTPVVFKMI
ncbi:type IX secretion system motor protein PorM/GldM [Acidiluteibacter ferrifornacis]|jgi:gliding motility-associated protein GldM|uniref:Gliding motility protein GldM n=1 Tax=Acidiluteibacter ferrifornacis TaxID=2692424 RepID=A0A6N9NF30_9FLAO|nr:gliding motility protein GldM [Acidiluteibacter ferrifornacis]NBG65248.1 gliding motility protein GldM [Acidiluteibacter ferrifornacis]